MYWQDVYRTQADAEKALALDAAGKVSLTPSQRHIAHVAMRAGLSGLTELPHLGEHFGTSLTEFNELGSLKSFIKKAVKVAGKLSPSHQLAKALKIDKFSPSQLLASKLEQTKKSSPKTPPALIAPATEVLPGAPPQPIPQLPEIAATSPMSFSQGGGSGGGGSSPAPVPGEVAAEESFFTTPVMIGLGLAAALALYLLMKKRR